MGSNGQDVEVTSFMAGPGTVADWRFVVLADAAVQAGLLGALPDSPAAVAARLDLDPQAVRIVLDALREWDVVRIDESSGAYHQGPTAVTGENADVLHHHARVIRRWSADVPDRLRGVVDTGDQKPQPEQRAAWLRALAAGARGPASTLAEDALRRFPTALRVLDVAGGHGEYGLAFARRGLEVTMQDLPETVELVSQWPSVRDSGVQLAAGDVFEQLPDGPFDLVLCCGFTHTQPGERIPGLLSRLRAVTAPGGGIAIRTIMRDQRPVGPVFAVQMLLGGRGADAHGWQEYQGWLATAGYEQAELVGADERALILAVAP